MFDGNKNWCVTLGSIGTDQSAELIVNKLESE
jgi:hypothetical protein